MEKREELILDHLGRYTISLKKVIDELYFDGGSAQNALNKLVTADLIQSIQNGLGGNFRYYQLTIKGAKTRSVPPNRAREKEPKGLSQDIAALWFSCMGDVRRKRLSITELRSLFGAPKGGNVIHIAEDAGEESTVYRLFVPSDNSSLRSFVATLKKSAHDAFGDERLLRWIERGTYTLLVLLQNESRREDLRRLIKDEEFPDIRIRLDLGPSATTLREFISPEKELS